jgi:pre-mRNA cleavage complex 2 protein Pcf11
MPSLREAMQSMLDEIQDDVDDLDKVSLERLAVIDADLLVKIKTGAEDSLRNTGSGGQRKDTSESTTNSKASEISFLVETRSPSTVATSKTWEKLKEDQIVKDTNTVIAGLNHIVREGSRSDKRYTQTEAIDVTGALATAAVTAAILTTTIQEMKNYKDTKARNLKMAAYGGSHGSVRRGQGHAAPTTLIVDKSLFTNDGVKELNLAIVGLLYDVGLPFSLNDGWRFATEKEMADHIDRKFKSAEAQKSISASHERGWYESDMTWTGKQVKDDANNKLGVGNSLQDDQAANLSEDLNIDPQSLTVPADEGRDRCVVCGINFSMMFDSEDGIYKFKNCREIEVLRDGFAPTEMLVHGTCWKSLGCPDVLNSDQASKQVMSSA